MILCPTLLLHRLPKPHVGHDEDISREDIISRKLVSENDYATLEKYALALFAKGTELAAKRGTDTSRHKV